jgi:glutamate/tyrosine decarboxylase-like PLP-dependent enzyme
VELVVMDWFKGMLGLPDTAAGLLVSGGSVASLTALAVARHAVLNDEARDARVYLSNQTHASVDRGLRILGISAAQMRRIPTDTSFRMDTAELEREIQRDLEAGFRPFAVVANAGATNTGAVDPLASIAEIARAYSLWFHVDAAYGGFAALTERGRRSLSGIEQADSVALDPHKWLYCSFEAGCVLVRNGGLMRETFRIMPEYMADVARQEREVNFCDYGLQLTRSFRALKVWMALKTYGARRFRQIIDRCLDLTEYAARLFERSPRIELVTRPQLGIFTFRYVPERLPATDTQAYLNRLNEKLVANITASGKLMLSSTRLGPQTVLRLCVLNHRTRKEDVKEALSIIEQLGREAEASLG